MMKLVSPNRFNWATAEVVAVLSSVDVIYAVESLDKSYWAFVQGGFGVGNPKNNNPNTTVVVLFMERHHDFPYPQ